MCSSDLLEYNTPFAGCGSFPCVEGPANLVFGQTDFSLAVCTSPNTNANNTCAPVGLAVDGSGNLYVADHIYNRVLEYDNPLAPGGGTPGIPGSAGDTAADRVFGQFGSFTSELANNGGIGADSLDEPEGVALDTSGNLRGSSAGTKA